MIICPFSFDNGNSNTFCKGMFILKQSLIIIVGTEFTHHWIIMGLKSKTTASHLQPQEIWLGLRKKKESKHDNHINYPTVS